MENKDQEITVDKLSDSMFYKMYLSEVRGKKVVPDAEQMELYKKLLNGDQTVSEQILESWLLKVIEMAKFYKETEVNMEDVIQEGNLGLWMALSSAPAETKAEDMEAYLISHVKNAMEDYIREVTGNTDQVQALVGKAALIYEAQEVLAQENGEMPSLRQLSDYTHIEPEEIQDLLSLFKEDETNMA